jgi:cellobiose phosphorylase
MPYLKKYGDGGELQEAAERMKEAINTHAWCEDRYAVAIHDDGTLLGDREDRLFLNTQSWAILSGVADEEKRRKIMVSIKRDLETPFGPLLMYPPFTGWDGRWGRVSVKQAGTTENGSVYCHASMFYAYAQAMLKDGDGLYETIKRTLPTNPENPPEHNLQNPIYLSNYYFGLRDSENFGRSSRHYGTGTVAWMLMLLVEEMLGIKVDQDKLDVLKVEPCLPQEWKEVTCTRRYKGENYRIHIVQEEGASYQVEMKKA